MAQMVKDPPAIQKTWIPSLGWEDPLEEGMATHSSILAWRILWTEEPGGLQSMGSQRLRHDWVTNTVYRVNLRLSSYLSHKSIFILKNIYKCNANIIPNKINTTSLLLSNTWPLFKFKGCGCMCLHTQSCLTLCSPMYWSLPGSSVHEISQARILEWVAISFCRGSSQPRDQTLVSALASRFFTAEPPGKSHPC